MSIDGWVILGVLCAIILFAFSAPKREPSAIAVAVQDRDRHPRAR